MAKVLIADPKYCSFSLKTVTGTGAGTDAYANVANVQSFDYGISRDTIDISHWDQVDNLMKRKKSMVNPGDAQIELWWDASEQGSDASEIIANDKFIANAANQMRIKGLYRILYEDDDETFRVRTEISREPAASGTAGLVDVDYLDMEIVGLLINIDGPKMSMKSAVTATLTIACNQKPSFEENSATGVADQASNS